MRDEEGVYPLVAKSIADIPDFTCYPLRGVQVYFEDAQRKHIVAVDVSDYGLVFNSLLGAIWGPSWIEPLSILIACTDYVSAKVPLDLARFDFKGFPLRRGSSL